MTRRKFLTIAVIGTISLKFPFRWVTQNHNSSAITSENFKYYLLQIFSDQNAPLYIGQRFLDLYPSQISNVILLANQIQSMNPPSSLAIKKILAYKRKWDFHKGHTVLIDGWLLSRTEVEACALTVVL